MARRDLPLLDQQTLNRVKPALLELRKALEFARQTDEDHWQFALTIEHLARQGLSFNDLRMLSTNGIIESADEIPAENGDQRRSYMPAPHLQFTDRSCFVLSRQGMEKMQKLQLTAPISASGKLIVPVWNPRLRELRFCGQLVRKFKWRAPNQEAVLQAFEEGGWPDLVDDPLDFEFGMDSKQRLHDTIKCLNRSHKRPLIRFHGDGTGRGVLWRTMPRVQGQRVSSPQKSSSIQQS